jgi:large subunit ribosomal protein L18
MAATSKTILGKRRDRIRSRIQRTAAQGKIRARLTIHRSSQHIYAQVIDDVKGVTLTHASTLDKELKEKLKSSANRDAATEVGKLVAQRAVKAGVKEVVFDRSGYLYHGRVKALADGAREGGLLF